MTDGSVVLDQPLPTRIVEASPAGACAVLREMGVRACCLDDPAQVASHTQSDASTVGDLLDAVVAENPSYRWEFGPDDTLLNLFPQASVLDEPAPELDVAGEGLWIVLERRLRLADHDIELFVELRDGDGPPVTATAPAGPLRLALNAVVAPLDKAVWDVSGSTDAWFLTVSSLS